MTNGTADPPTPTSSASDPPLGPLPPLDRTAANHSDSDGGQSNTGSRRLVFVLHCRRTRQSPVLIRNTVRLLTRTVLPPRRSLIRYNSSTLPALPSSLLHHQSSKSSESDLSTSTLPISSSTLPIHSSSSHTLFKLPLSQPETGLLLNSTSPTSTNNPPSSSASPGAPPVQRPPMPQTSLALTPPRDTPSCGFNGCPASHPASSPGLVLPLGSGSPVSAPGGELVPVALSQTEGGGLGFSVTTGGQSGQLVVVRRVWDRRQCPSLQLGDAIVKINGADVQSLSLSQVNTMSPTCSQSVLRWFFCMCWLSKNMICLTE